MKRYFYINITVVLESSPHIWNVKSKEITGVTKTIPQLFVDILYMSAFSRVWRANIWNINITTYTWWTAMQTRQSYQIHFCYICKFFSSKWAGVGKILISRISQFSIITINIKIKTSAVLVELYQKILPSLYMHQYERPDNFLCCRKINAHRARN